MSIVALSWVLRHSEARLGPRLVLIALAEFAHDDGSKAFPSVETLIERTRLSRTGVKDGLRKLRDDGHIVQTGSTRSGTAVYRVVIGGSESDRPESDPGRNPTARGSESDPDPSVNRHVLSDGERESAGARTPKRIGSAPVKPEAWALTVRVLAEFNRQTGRSVGPVTGAGEASESAKRIYGRVRAFPDVTLVQHADIIRRTLASRWWGDGEASVGVVYGPKVFEENLTRSGSPNGARHSAADASTGSARMRAMAAELRRDPNTIDQEPR